MKAQSKKPPLILITPCLDRPVPKHGRSSLSLICNYPNAILDAGGIPVVMPRGVSRPAIAELVRRVEGVLITGGEDTDPRLYHRGKLPPKVAKTVGPIDHERDYLEMQLLEQVFHQRKAFLGICRGQQITNIALGGTLYADVRLQKEGAIRHGRFDRRYAIIHDVILEPHSLMARATGQLRMGVNSSHHQAVDRVAPMLQVTGRSPDGVIECLELKPEAAKLLPFFHTVQFHPERLFEQFEACRAVFTTFVRACDRAR